MPISLFGWVMVAVGLFTLTSPRRAALAAYIIAWLFLPQAGIPMPGLPDLDKVTASGMGVAIGIVLFDARTLTAFRFSWVDLPIIAWCATSLTSSVTNDLGWYDGFAGVLRDFFTWGIPYFVGRMYFRDLESLRELAIGVFLGGLVYVPLCLLEIRLSPQLHRWVYGFHPASFAMTIRLGGYRPTVFMQHGLAVGMWMTSAALAGIWLWRTGALRAVRNMPMMVLVPVLLGTTILCRSMGALALLGLGICLLFINQIVRSNVVLIVVLLVAPAYMLVRTQGWWDGQQLLNIAMSLNVERGESLAGRLRDEDLLIAKASERATFGWGGWGRWRVRDEYTGENMTSSDGMWVIVRGERGNVGLAVINIIVLLPIFLLLLRVPARSWSQAAYAGPAVLAMLLMMWSIDNLFNAMYNPVFTLAAGGLAGFYVAYPQLMARYRAMQQQQMAMMMMAQQQALQQQQRRAAAAQRAARAHPDPRAASGA